MAVPEPIPALRAEFAAQPSDEKRALDLARALGAAGCGHEAGVHLRPRRAAWRDASWASDAKAWLAATTWWNSNWREVALARQSGRYAEARSMVGDRASALWDFPPLLAHLEAIARADGDWAEVAHLDARIVYLCERGVPKIPTAAFDYLARVGLLEARAEQGQPEEALTELEALNHHPGNQHHYQMRLAELTVLADKQERAMRRVAEALITAGKRTGYSKTLRETWVEHSPRLEPLRARPDWPILVAEPKEWLAEHGAP